MAIKRMRKQCVPGALSPPPSGNEATHPPAIVTALIILEGMIVIQGRKGWDSRSGTIAEVAMW